MEQIMENDDLVQFWSQRHRLFTHRKEIEMFEFLKPVWSSQTMWYLAPKCFIFLRKCITIFENRVLDPFPLEGLQNRILHS